MPSSSLCPSSWKLGKEKLLLSTPPLGEAVLSSLPARVAEASPKKRKRSESSKLEAGVSKDPLSCRRSLGKVGLSSLESSVLKVLGLGLESSVVQVFLFKLAF